MRTITATHLAAAKSLKGKPAISAVIKDDRLRWTLLHWTDGSARKTGMAVTGSTIWRVRSDASGNIQTATVTVPTTKAQWTTWTTRAMGMLPDSDVSIGITDNTIYLVHISSTGTEVIITSSPDLGNTWPTQETVASGLSGTIYLFTVNNAVIIQNGTTITVYTKSGTWGLRATWTTSAVTNAGVSAAFVASNYRLIAAYDGKILVRTLNPTGWTWGTALQVAPGGTGSAPSVSNLRWPCVAHDSTHYYYSWIDELTGTPTWTQPVIHQSKTWGYIGNEVALNIWGDSYRRVDIVYVSSTRALYAANEKCICRAYTYSATDSTQNLSGLTVIGYKRRTREQESRLVMEVLNTGAYDTLGTAGQTAECIRPLAKVLLSRGYITSAGSETVTLDPHYIISARLTAGKGKGLLTIEAVDAWGLLDLWRAAEPLTWTSRTIAWLLSMVCHRVGLSWSDNGDTAFDETLPTFTITPGMNGADAVRELLRLAGGVAWPDVNGNLYGVNLYAYGPLTYIEAGPSEILSAEYGSLAYYATSLRVFGTGAASASELGSESMDLGLRVSRSYDDYRANSSTITGQMQNYLWTRARISGRDEKVTIPMRPDPELWDIASITDPEGIIAPGDKLRMINGLNEDYDPKRGVLTTTLHLLDA